MLHKLNPVRAVPVIVSILLLIIIFLILKSGFVKSESANTYHQETDQKYALNYEQLEKFSQEIKQTGGKTTYLKLKTETQDLPFKTKHDLAHLFGKALYKTEGTASVATCDSNLSFGCYHGLFIEAITTEGIEVIPKLDLGCAKAGQNLYTGCQHGIGHGLVEYYGHKDSDLSQALAQCKRVQQNLLVGCSSGVFMEFFFPSSLNENKPESPKIDPDNPFKICSSLDPDFKNSCIYEIPRLWRQTENDYSKLSERCMSLDSDPTLKKSCFRGLGYSTGNSSNPAPEFSLSVCNKMPNEQIKLYCLSGATWFYSTIDRTEKVTTAINSLCKESNNEQECKKLSNLKLDKI